MEHLCDVYMAKTYTSGCVFLTMNYSIVLPKLTTRAVIAESRKQA